MKFPFSDNACPTSVFIAHVHSAAVEVPDQSVLETAAVYGSDRVAVQRVLSNADLHSAFFESAANIKSAQTKRARGVKAKVPDSGTPYTAANEDGMREGTGGEGAEEVEEEEWRIAFSVFDGDRTRLPSAADKSSLTFDRRSFFFQKDNGEILEPYCSLVDQQRKIKVVLTGIWTQLTVVHLRTS